MVEMYNVVYKRKELYQTNSLAKAKAKAISYCHNHSPFKLFNIFV